MLTKYTKKRKEENKNIVIKNSPERERRKEKWCLVLQYPSSMEVST